MAVPENLHQIMSALRRIKCVHLKGSAAQPEPAWQLTGEGSVQVETLPSGLLLREKGQLIRDQVTLNYQASWTMEADGDQILWLGHARTGTPVRLLTLRPEPDGGWVSPRPHICGADQYEAALHLQADAVQLRWHVRGPGKCHTLYRHFTPTPLNR